VDEVKVELGIQRYSTFRNKNLVKSHQSIHGDQTVGIFDQLRKVVDDSLVMNNRFRLNIKDL